MAYFFQQNLKKKKQKHFGAVLHHDLLIWPLVIFLPE